MAGDDTKSSPLEDDDDEDPYYQDLLNVMASPNPNLMDMITFTDNPPPPVIPSPFMEVNENQFMHELNLSITNCDTNDEFDGLSFVDDDFSIGWEMFATSNHDLNDIMNNDVSREIGNDNGKHIVGETTRLDVSTRVFGDNNGPNFEIGSSSNMPVPITPTISDGVRICNCCNVLRELVHTDGYETNTLEIRGGIGFFCHAVLGIQPFAGSRERQYQTLDLKDLTMEEVKHFIENYCFQRVARNLSLVLDTNAAFYQAMNVNTTLNQSQSLTIPSSDDVPVSLVMPNQGLNVPFVPPYVGLSEEPTTGLPKVRPRRQTPLAAQRERTGKLTLKDISMHFHLPIEDAARKMNLCPTVLKKICRKGGLMRWPHRKIKSLERKITALQSVLRTAKDEEVRANAEMSIDRLQKQIDTICSEALKKMK